MSDHSPAEFVWDVQAALENVDGNVEDLKQLLEIWLRQTPRLLTSMRTALESGDAKSLSISAHTLNGSLQILCAQDQCFAAEELERAGKTGQIFNGTELLGKLETQIAALTPQIMSFLQAHASQ